MRLYRAGVGAAFLAACGQSGPGSPNPAAIELADVSEAAFGGWLPAGTPATEFTIGTGAALGDLDGDGDLDLVIAGFTSAGLGSPAEPAQLLRNVTATGGPIQFEVDADFAVLTGDLDAYGVALGDYDHDGDLDVFFAAGGPDRLLRNDGGSFVDVTAMAGVAGLDQDSSAAALFVDLNDDGQLDLYVGNYHHGADWVLGPSDADRLHLNLGDGSFAEISGIAGTGSLGAAHTAAAADLDGDGIVELLVANDAFPIDDGSGETLPPDALYARARIDDQGTPVFDDVAGARGVAAPRLSMGVALADFDADDDLDIYVTDWGDKDLMLWDPGAGTYAEAAADFGLANRDLGGILLIGWGALPLDLDRDGALELLVVNGELRPASEQAPYQLDYYFRQPEPGARFADISESVGLPVGLDPGDPTRPAAGRGAFAGDLDGDGDLDLVLGAVAESFRVYDNRTPPAGHFVRLRLIGTASAPDPIGALVTVVTDGDRSVTRQRTAGGETYGQGDNLVELGLGDELPARVEVAWPSGLVQRIDGLADFAADREVRVVEPAWLALSTRVAGAADPAPVLTYSAVGEDGAALGAAGAGRTVTVSRSDAVEVTVIDHGDGSYTADLPHPGAARRTTLAIEIDGAPVRLAPMLTYR